MDGGLFSGQRPADRRAAAPNRATAAAKPVEELHPPVEHARQVPATRVHTKKKSPKKRVVLPLLILLVVLLVGVGAWFGIAKFTGGAAAIDGSKYQAVFFTNGQVYFGKLQLLSGGYLKLTDIYYLQSQSQANSESEDLQKTAPQQSNNVQLIKLGEEIHGPEDVMIINKDQVLFYENLKSDGKVAQIIAQAKGR